jgi:hypothetical protein
MPETTEETYEDWNMEELREELKARDLHTSGNKDELITRLEENDAQVMDAPVDEEEPKASATAVVPTAEDEEGEAPFYEKRVYSPFELPSNTTAAQAFTDAHPDDVDPSLELATPELTEMAQANIQDHVDTMAQFGIMVDDPRLEGYTPPPDGGGGENPPEGPAVTGVEPATGPQNTVTALTITGTGLSTTTGNPVIGKSCHNTVINDDTSIDTDTPGNQAAGTFPVVVTLSDSSILTGPDFTYT